MNWHRGVSIGGCSEYKWAGERWGSFNENGNVKYRIGKKKMKYLGYKMRKESFEYFANQFDVRS